MVYCNKVMSISYVQMSLWITILYSQPSSSVQNTNYVKTYYTKELFLLWKGTGIQPCNLNVHKKTNTLFFCFNRPKNFDSQIAYYKIDTKEIRTVTDMKKGCANAIDQINDVVYLGGLQGIYKYNMKKEKSEFFAEKNVYITSLFYHERLYYIRYPDRKVFMEYEDKFAHIAEFMDLKVDHFHVSREGIVYFAVKNSIYMFDKNQTRWDLKGLRKMHTVNAISEDNYGVMYLCTNRGVFTVLKHGLQRFMHERNIVGLTTDRDNNLILADNAFHASGDPRAGAYFSQGIALAVERGNAASVMGSMPQAELLDGLFFL